MKTTMRTVAPGIFSLDNSGNDQAIALISGMPALAMIPDFRSAGQPAQMGDTLSLIVTGLGTPADGLLEVKLGELTIIPESVEPVDGHAGVYALQMRVPSGSPVGDAVKVQLQLRDVLGRILESNVATVAIHAN